MNTDGGGGGGARGKYLKRFEKEKCGRSEQRIVIGKSEQDAGFQDELLQLLAENPKLGFLNQDLALEQDSVSNTTSGGTLGNSNFLGGKDFQNLKDENAMLRFAVEKLVDSKVNQTQHLMNLESKLDLLLKKDDAGERGGEGKSKGSGGKKSKKGSSTLVNNF